MERNVMRRELYTHNRASWNAATVAHNSHKGDQARFFCEGGSTLHLEEIELLGEVLTAIGQAGLCIKRLHEYPHSIAMRFHPMREIPGYRTMPLESIPLVPLLFGLQAEKP